MSDHLNQSDASSKPSLPDVRKNTSDIIKTRGFPCAICSIIAIDIGNGMPSMLTIFKANLFWPAPFLVNVAFSATKIFNPSTTSSSEHYYPPFNTSYLKLAPVMKLLLTWSFLSDIAQFYLVVWNDCRIFKTDCPVSTVIYSIKPYRPLWPSLTLYQSAVVLMPIRICHKSDGAPVAGLPSNFLQNGHGIDNNTPWTLSSSMAKATRLWT